MTESHPANWYADPSGRHQHRYYDGTTWTDQVADGGVQAVDPLVAAPVQGGAPTTAPQGSFGPAQAAPAAAGVPAASVRSINDLPDDPAGAPKRRMLAFVLLGCCAVVCLSMFLPWLEPKREGGGRSSLNGISTSAGLIFVFIAVGLAVFAWQGLGRPRVRYGIGAIIGAVCLVMFSFMAAVSPANGDIEAMGMTPASERTVAGGVVIERTGSAQETSVENANLVNRGIGSDIAFGASLVALWPSIALFLDDRRRRQAFQLAAIQGVA